MFYTLIIYHNTSALMSEYALEQLSFTLIPKIFTEIFLLLTVSMVVSCYVHVSNKLTRHCTSSVLECITDKVLCLIKNSTEVSCEPES